MVAAALRFLRADEYRETRLDVALPALAIAAFLVAWYLAVALFRLPAYVLPSPVTVVVELGQRWRLFVFHGSITLWTVIVGFLLSIAIAVPLAVLIVSSRLLERTLMPLIVVSQTVPKVAVAPLFVIWLGFGALPKIAVTFLIAFFPILVATISGLKSVETELLDLVRSMSANRAQILGKVQAPSALPQFFSGLKISICLAVVGAIVGEFVGSDRGLGYLLLTSTGDLNAKQVYATLLILIFVGVSLYGIICALEKRMLPWHVSVRGADAVIIQA
jgi:NitT/TauT family transport system permease protein